MKVRELMTRDPACCTPNDTVERAARLMEQNDCGCIPVVDNPGNSTVLGVVTDRDITVRGTGHGKGPNTEVSNVMTEDVCCCSPEADVREVEQLMADRQIRRVVVVDEGGCCVGMVAQADLALAAERGREVSDDEVGRVVERISEPRQRSEWRL